MKRTRTSDSPLILGVTERTYTGVADVTLPDGCWDFVVIKHSGKVDLLLTGAITQPVPLEFPPGTEVMNITFKPAVFLPQLPSPDRINKGIAISTASPKLFHLGNHTLEIPTFDNAELFAERLLRYGLLEKDQLVASVLNGTPMAASERSVQRHFQYTTGLTYKYFAQIQRAEKALSLLQAGMPALQVALAVGYSDQSHMINSLRRIMGQTPKKIQQSKP